jgi:hypothetical protein
MLTFIIAICANQTTGSKKQYGGGEMHFGFQLEQK